MTTLNLHTLLEDLARTDGGPKPFTYSEVQKQTGIYRRNLARPLELESRLSNKVHGVLVSALVVSAATHLPGEGFYALAAELGRNTSDRQECWRQELLRIRSAYQNSK